MAAEKIRELRVPLGHPGLYTDPYRVSNLRGIIDPGKFQGLFPHAVRDYDLEDESFGDTAEWGTFAWQVGHRYYITNTDGFVTEIDEEEYHALKDEHAKWDASDEADDDV
jgi:hypothetical protein